MNKLVFKTLFLTFILCLSLSAKQSFVSLNENKVYFLPNQSKAVKKEIIDLISNAKESIIVSMYNFSYKKFAEKLIEASSKGIKVKVYLDKSKIKKDDEIYKLLKKNNIKVEIPKNKLHTKIAIFDEKIFMIGSSNWTKKSFKENNEVILFTKDKKVINQVQDFLNNL